MEQEKNTFSSFSLTTLQESPFLKQKLFKLLHTSFEYQKSFAFHVDFFPLFNAPCLNYLLYDCHKQEVIGHIGVKARELILKNKKIKGHFLGGLCISSNYQGKGLFRWFFDCVLAKLQDASFLLLWSDKIEFYKKWSFNPYGQTKLISVSENQLISFKPLIDPSLKEIQQLHYLYDAFQKKFFTRYRTIKDWQELLQIKSASVLVQRHHGVISHYFIKNKGMDLQNVIHEYSLNFYEEYLHHFERPKQQSENDPIHSSLWALIPLFCEKQDKQNNQQIIPGGLLKLNTLNDSTSLFEQEEKNFFIFGLDSL